jgi:hypothetical protein
MEGTFWHDILLSAKRLVKCHLVVAHALATWDSHRHARHARLQLKLIWRARGPTSRRAMPPVWPIDRARRGGVMPIRLPI